MSDEKRETIEISEKHKTGLTKRIANIPAVKRTAEIAAQSYFDCIVDSMDIPKDFVWSEENMCFVKKSEKPEPAKGKTDGSNDTPVDK